MSWKRREGDKEKVQAREDVSPKALGGQLKVCCQFSELVIVGVAHVTIETHGKPPNQRESHTAH